VLCRVAPHSVLPLDKLIHRGLARVLAPVAGQAAGGRLRRRFTAANGKRDSNLWNHWVAGVSLIVRGIAESHAAKRERSAGRHNRGS